jgi:hypothetical protein
MSYFLNISFFIWVLSFSFCNEGRSDGALDLLKGKYKYDLSVKSEKADGIIDIKSIDKTANILNLSAKTNISKKEYEFGMSISIDNNHIKLYDINIPPDFPIKDFKKIIVELVFDELIPRKVDELINVKDNEEISLLNQKTSFESFSPMSVRRIKDGIILSFSAVSLQLADKKEKSGSKVKKEIIYKFDNQRLMLESVDVEYISYPIDEDNLLSKGEYRIKIARLNTDEKK